MLCGRRCVISGSSPDFGLRQCAVQTRRTVRSHTNHWGGGYAYMVLAPLSLIYSYRISWAWLWLKISGYCGPTWRNPTVRRIVSDTGPGCWKLVDLLISVRTSVDFINRVGSLRKAHDFCQVAISRLAGLKAHRCRPISVVNNVNNCIRLVRNTVCGPRIA